jgi:hypothetical protein
MHYEYPSPLKNNQFYEYVLMHSKQRGGNRSFFYRF